MRNKIQEKLDFRCNGFIGLRKSVALQRMSDVWDHLQQQRIHPPRAKHPVDAKSVIAAHIMTESSVQMTAHCSKRYVRARPAQHASYSELPIMALDPRTQGGPRYPGLPCYSAAAVAHGYTT